MITTNKQNDLSQSPFWVSPKESNATIPSGRDLGRLFLVLIFFFTPLLSLLPSPLGEGLGVRWGEAHAQQNYPDSLKRILASAPQDTNRAKLLDKLSYCYLASKPDTALVLAKEELALARKLNWSKGEANGLSYIGNIFYITGNYPRALENYIQALKIFERVNNQAGIANCLSNIGGTYGSQGDYRQELVYYFKAKIIYQKIHDDKGLAVALSNIGNVYNELNQLDSARFYTHQGYELALRIHNEGLIGYALALLGEIHSKMGEHALAMEYYRLSIPYLKRMGGDSYICGVTMGIAKLFKKAGSADSALYYAAQSLDIAQKAGFTAQALEAGNFLADYYKEKNNIEKAYFYQQITIAAKDSLFSQEKVKQTKDMMFNEELRQQELEAQKLKDEEARMKNLQLAGIGTAIPTLFLFLLFFRRRKVKRRVIEVLGILGLLMAFEFIYLLIKPYIEEWTRGIPVLMLLVFVAVAAILIPLHRKVEHWVKEKLAYKHTEEVAPELNEK